MKKSQGQAVLIIVLLMAVALTVGVAIVSRSITDVKLSSQDEESARAFSAAEAGLDIYLSGDAATSTLSEGTINYSVTTSTLGESTSILFPKQLAAGESQSLWLVNHSEDGQIDASSYYSDSSITVYWGNPGDTGDGSPALEATLFYKDFLGDYKVTRWAFDAKKDIRNNNFSSSVTVNSEAIAGLQQTVVPAYSTTITLPSSPNIPYLLNLKPLYNSDSVWVGVKSSSGNFPAQATCYKSTAQIIASGVTRAVNQCRYFKTPGALFDYALFSTNSDSGLAK